MRKILHIAILFLILVSCETRETIKVLHAGSLSVPLKVIAEQFEQEHPRTKVQLEGAGSLTCIRKITDLQQPCDVLAVADYALIDELMIPDEANYNILFAGNELAIGFIKGSVWEKRLTQNNWMDLILADTVSYGRADPDHDPSGYRTVILADLAERMSDRKGFRQAFEDKNRRYIRPKGTELLPLLETGTIDLVFHYRSVLVQHQLGFLELPDSLNLSHPALNNWYASGCIDITGSKPGSQITKCGEAMVYGLTQPAVSKNRNGGDAFIRYLLEEGNTVLDSLGQPPLHPKLSNSSIHKPEWFNY